jgi:thioredoxin 1
LELRISFAFRGLHFAFRAQATILAPARARRYGRLNIGLPSRVDEGGWIMSAVQEVTDATFDQEVLKSDVPVLIDFWAPWCGPCKAIAPVVDELANTYSGKLKVVKMNVDDNPATPGNYGVRSIPNLLIIKGGEVKDQIIGAVPKTQLQKAIDQVV